MNFQKFSTLRVNNTKQTLNLAGLGHEITSCGTCFCFPAVTNLSSLGGSVGSLGFVPATSGPAATKEPAKSSPLAFGSSAQQTGFGAASTLPQQQQPPKPAFAAPTAQPPAQQVKPGSH